MSERDDITEQAYHLPPALFSREEADALGKAFDKRFPPKEDIEEYHTMQELVHNTATGFNLLLKMQHSLEEKWGRDVDVNDPEAVSRHIRDTILCTTDELHEVLAEVNWKPWKDSRGIKDVDKYREEMADVLHFVLSLYLAAGVSGQEIVTDYMAKHQENLARTRSAEYKAS
jgi:NTP pyrophosphatase (non-canonical NTP hydrolase)